jgi:SAM-dependent methyltransferase
VTGVDLSPAAVVFAASRRAAPVVRGSISSLPFRSESFDVVTSFDVIYHLDVADDVVALAEMARVLGPGGTLLLRVPAYDRMRSHHDEAVHTRQRYERAELVAKLEQAGLTPTLVTFANCLLFPLAWMKRAAESVRPPRHEGSEVQAVSPLLNAIFERALGIEARLLRRGSLPFGLSLVALARKEGDVP